jgi:hypothetical protein
MNLSNEAKQSAKRLAIRKLLHFVRGLLVKALTSKAKGRNKSALETSLNEFLSTKEGEAVLGTTLGILIPQVTPHLGKMPMFAKFEKVLLSASEELRVAGMTELGCSLMDQVENVLPMLTSGALEMLNGLQDSQSTESERVRVELSNAGTDSLETSEREEKEALRTVRAR